jgi:uncharacterized C2H2 Zn-finger protein
VRLFSKKEGKDNIKKKCKYCDMVFESDERLRRHIRKAHDEKNSDMPNFNPFGT